MPVRTVEIHLRNTTEFRLEKNFAHLCWGDWRPGTGAPPDAIEPNSEVTFRAESGGPASGTEGYVKYNLLSRRVDAQGRDRGPDCVYIYWDNPFVGPTCFCKKVASGDIYPDCDFDVPEGGSSFTPSEAPFRLEQDGPLARLEGGATWAELGAAALFSATGSHGLWLVTSAGNVAHPHIAFRLEPMQVRNRLEPSFVATPESVFVPLHNRPLSYWAGRWEAREEQGSALPDIDVRIEPGANGLGISINDQTQGGRQGHKTQGHPLFGSSMPHTKEIWPVDLPEFQARRVNPNNNEQVQVRRLRPRSQNTSWLSAMRQSDSRILDKMLRWSPVDRVAIEERTALEAYGEFSNGAFLSSRLRYIRWQPNGKVVADVLLKKRDDIR